MSKVTIPAGYKTPLSTYEMQRAIEFIKSNFQVNLVYFTRLAFARQ